MGFFTTKKEVKLEDFCRDFYSKNILDGTIQGIDVNETMYKGFKELIVEVFPEFSKIEFNKLKEEFNILRFELFTLAWHDSFDDDLSLAQNIFTMRFLEEKNKQDIWDRMGRYNGAIASGIRKAICINEKDNEILNSERLNTNYMFAEKAEKCGIDMKEEKNLDLIRRMGSRIKSDKGWKNGRGMIPYFLSLTLLRILGYSDSELDLITNNQNISARLMRIIQGFYDGAKESWKDVKIINL